jgi:hypothetical protein
LSKKKALKAIDRLCEFSPDDCGALLEMQYALADSFSHNTTRHNAVALFQETLVKWESTPPHANEPQKLQAHVSLLHKLIKTLQRTRRKRKRRREEDKIGYLRS